MSGLKVVCVCCRIVLDVPGAIVIGPPKDPTELISHPPKFHVCVDCWPTIEARLLMWPTAPDGTRRPRIDAPTQKAIDWLRHSVAVQAGPAFMSDDFRRCALLVKFLDSVNP